MSAARAVPLSSLVDRRYAAAIAGDGLGWLDDIGITSYETEPNYLHRSSRSRRKYRTESQSSRWKDSNSFSARGSRTRSTHPSRYPQEASSSM